MSRLAALLRSLPRALNIDAQTLPGLTVSRTLGAGFTIQDYMLTSTAASGRALNFDVRAYTMTTLVAAINAVSGYSAAVASGAGSVGAYALIEGTYDGTGGATVTIPYFNSNTYRMLAPVAASFRDVDDEWVEGVNQADLRHSVGIWVDRWGLLYGVTRSTNETDATYARRLAFSAIQAKTNNTSMAIILQQALGIASAVVTDSVVPGMFTLTLTLSDTQSTVYDTGTINGFIKLYKALGTLGILNLATQAQGVEAYSTTTTPVDTLIDSVQAPTGAWGAPEFGIRERAL